MDYKDDNIWLMQGDCLERMKEITREEMLKLVSFKMVDGKWAARAKPSPVTCTVT